MTDRLSVIDITGHLYGVDLFLNKTVHAQGDIHVRKEIGPAAVIGSSSLGPRRNLQRAAKVKGLDPRRLVSRCSSLEKLWVNGHACRPAYRLNRDGDRARA